MSRSSFFNNAIRLSFNLRYESQQLNGFNFKFVTKMYVIVATQENSTVKILLIDGKQDSSRHLTGGYQIFKVSHSTGHVSGVTVENIPP